MRERGGYRMGPFELMDLIGIDVNLEVARSFYRQRPSPGGSRIRSKRRCEAGSLGRKAGAGFTSTVRGGKVDPGLGRDAGPLTRGDPRADRRPARKRGELRGGRGRGQPDEIDTAMRLGLNHPRGPFEWQRELGADLMVQVLEELAESARGAAALPGRAAAARRHRGLRRGLAETSGGSALRPGNRPSAARYDPPTISARPATVEAVIDSSRSRAP